MDAGIAEGGQGFGRGRLGRTEIAPRLEGTPGQEEQVEDLAGGHFRGRMGRKGLGRTRSRIGSAFLLEASASRRRKPGGERQRTGVIGGRNRTLFGASRLILFDERLRGSF